MVPYPNVVKYAPDNLGKWMFNNMTPMVEKAIEQIWVNVTEGAELTGYNRNYVVKLAKKIWDKPEQERLIKLRRRSNGYELWLPDLINYMTEHGYGPQKPVQE